MTGSREIGETIGYQLRRLRRLRGLTQEGLADRANVSRDLVAKLEQGRRQTARITSLVSLACALDVELSALVERAGDSPAIRERARTMTAENSPGAALSITVDDGEVEDDVDRRRMLKVLGVGVASRGEAFGVRGLVLDAARSSAMVRASVETLGISQFAMANVRGRLCRLATNYALTSDLTMLRELVELRDELHRTLTTCQHHPSDTRDLYVLLGAACVLLASISHDLSEPYAGMTQATTAETFAELAGHRGLLTWVYCTKAMIASWWATPAEVLHHAHKAHAVGAAGIPAIRLAGLQARALAQLGKRTEAIAVMNAAQDQRDKYGEQNDLQELGEVFTFPLPRQHYYNAAAHLHLANWADVERETVAVNDLYDAPATGQAWSVTLTLTRIYQAQARLQRHGPEGASDALRPVFDLPDEQRVPQAAQALSGLRNTLQSKPFSALSAARDLSDAIGSFQSSAPPQ